MILLLISLIVVILSSALLTALIRSYSLNKGLIDTPNHRSSHSSNTPRGGGASFVTVFLLCLVCLLYFGYIESTYFYALFGCSSIIALTGWVDDHRHVSPVIRLIIHLCASAWVLLILGNIIFELPLGVDLATLSIVGFVPGLIGLVWMTNIFNFMDGIDGITSIETISVCLCAAFLAWVTHSTVGTWLVPLLLAASVSGFLFWNFPAARIFMGDVGSGFLGITTGTLALYSASVNPDLFWTWSILSGVFVVDATTTLLRRIIVGKRFTEAHNSHAYQHASRQHASHVKVSLAVLMINIFWLFPVSYCVVTGSLGGLWGLLTAYVPLGFLAIFYHAGKN